jgi:hypothetical protein
MSETSEPSLTKTPEEKGLAANSHGLGLKFPMPSAELALMLGALLFLVILVAVLIADSIRQPTTGVLASLKTEWLKVKLGGSAASFDLLREQINCKVLTIRGDGSLSLIRTAIRKNGFGSCRESGPQCRFSLPIRFSGKTIGDVIVNKLTAASGDTLTLSVSENGAHPELSIDGARIETSVTINRNATIESNGVGVILDEMKVPALAIERGQLEIKFESCDPISIPQITVTNVGLSEERHASDLSVYSDRRLTEGKLRLTDFKDRTIELERGSDVRLSGLDGVMTGTIFQERAISVRVAGTVKGLYAGYGATLADRTPSILEWLLEWHFVQVVLGTTITCFAAIVGVVLWYWEKGPKISKQLVLAVAVCTALTASKRPAQAELRDFTGALQRLKAAVAMVHVGRPDRLDGKGCPVVHDSYGTGFIVARTMPEGRFVLATADHVVAPGADDPQKKIFVEFDGAQCKQITLPALRFDALDLAILQILPPAGGATPAPSLTYMAPKDIRDFGFDSRLYALGWGDVRWEMLPEGGAIEQLFEDSRNGAPKVRFQSTRVVPGYSGGPVINSCEDVVAMITDGAGDQKIGLNIGKVMETVINASSNFKLPKIELLAERRPFCVNVDPTPYRIQDNNIRVTFALRIPSSASLVQAYARRLKRIYYGGGGPALSAPKLDTDQVYGFPPLVPGSPFFFQTDNGDSSASETQALNVINRIQIRLYCYSNRMRKSLFAGAYKAQLYPEPQLSLTLRPRLLNASSNAESAFWIYNPLEDEFILYGSDQKVPIGDLKRSSVQYITELFGGGCFVLFDTSGLLQDTIRQDFTEMIQMTKVCIRLALNSNFDTRIYPIALVESPVATGNTHYGPLPNHTDALNAGQFWRSCDL